MKVEVTKEQFTKLVEALLTREKVLSQVYKLGLAGLVDDIGESSVFYEKTLLDGLMEQSGRYQEFMSDIYDRKELPNVEGDSGKILGRIRYIMVCVIICYKMCYNVVKIY